MSIVQDSTFGDLLIHLEIDQAWVPSALNKLKPKDAKYPNSKAQTCCKLKMMMMNFASYIWRVYYRYVYMTLSVTLEQTSTHLLQLAGHYY